MIVLIAFSFLAGIVTVLSPCILPVLPIVLSSSIGGGRKRPFGVVAGFILSFTFFTLFLASIVNVLGIPADTLRNFSVVVIFLFGLSFLFSGTQVLLERLFAKLSGLVPTGENKEGFWGGLFIGLSIGLIWTPCVGPILASVISLALTGTVTGTAVFITFAYSLGTAIPMLGIVYGGRKLLNRVSFLTANTGKIQKIFGIIMILTAIGIYLNYDRKFQSYILEKFPSYGAGLTSLEDNEAVRQELDKLKDGGEIQEENMGKPMNEFMREAPDLIQGGEWFNSDPLILDELEGNNVVLIDFWTYTCINCIRTLPYLKNWHAKYADDGLVIIGVHTPEFEFEKSADNLQKAITDFELSYPVMQDNNYETWRAYNNRYWPAKYLIDKNGNIRYTHFGEGKYDETEAMIQKLLAETGKKVDEEIENPDYQVETKTPELYLGFSRMRFLATPDQLVKGGRADYESPEVTPLHHFAFDGEWEVGSERAMAFAGSSLTLRFEAKDVFLVMRSVSGSGRVRVFLDGEAVQDSFAGEDVRGSVVEIDKDRLYDLISLPESGDHTLRLEFLDSNVEVFAFTFG